MQTTVGFENPTSILQSKWQCRRTDVNADLTDYLCLCRDVCFFGTSLYTESAEHLMLRCSFLAMKSGSMWWREHAEFSQPQRKEWSLLWQSRHILCQSPEMLMSTLLLHTVRLGRSTSNIFVAIALKQPVVINWFHTIEDQADSKVMKYTSLVQRSHTSPSQSSLQHPVCPTILMQCWPNTIGWY